ncbi:hypothetical protein [Phyllobacterium myrsinacearum]|uniref:Bacteriophage T4 Gp32 single-stranded DNA-binding domain-containing protein n=1 Tax=Phyllobacterium myrsinacearum TaxID=28101 RepID=A0A839EUJ2_9HYPH|nr:hypothetical protein [Phyllobacterium myrsinacearum]MBA8881775.1 hypothetical protein [Phyllobacterium myrsinacearum]
MALNPALMKLVSKASSKYSRSTGTRIKPKEGRNRYRVLAPTSLNAPWIGEDGQFWADLGVHWIKAELNGKPQAVVGCRDVCYGEPCELDAAIDLAINSAIDEESKKIYTEWRAKKSILLNVVDHAGSKDECAILEVTPTTFAQITDLIQQYGENEVDITDPQNGMDIVITKTGKGLNTEYSVNVFPGKSEPISKDVLTRLHDLKAHIEKEFFRGDEKKALAFIAQTSGVALPRIGGPATTKPGLLTTGKSTPTKALVSEDAAVDDAVIDDSTEIDTDVDLDALNEATTLVKTPAKPVTKAAVKPAPVAEPEDADDTSLDDILADLDNIE